MLENNTLGQLMYELRLNSAKIMWTS